MERERKGLCELWGHSGLSHRPQCKPALALGLVKGPGVLWARCIHVLVGVTLRITQIRLMTVKMEGGGW